MMDRRMVKDALIRAEGFQTCAVEILGISERALRYKLRKLGLKDPIPDTRGERG